MKQHLNTLYITTDNSRLSLEGESVVISLNSQRLGRVPLHHLQAIHTFGWSISFTPQLMSHCAEIGVHISICNPFGKLLCNVVGFTQGNVLLRRQQYRLADCADASLTIAREMIAAKILNCRTLLQRAVRDKSILAKDLQPVINKLGQSVRAARKAISNSELLGIEGNAAERYFSVFSFLIANDSLSFSGRIRRPPLTPVNSLLSFVYTLLSADCKSALESVGLDSAVGVFHRDRPGRPGLALDLMEEFRAPLADRLVLSLLNRRQIKMSDFITEAGGAVRLTDDARRCVLNAWQERKKEQVLHAFLQEKMSIGLLFQIQARLLAQHVRGSLDSYPPVIWK